MALNYFSVQKLPLSTIVYFLGNRLNHKASINDCHGVKREGFDERTYIFLFIMNKQFNYVSAVYFKTYTLLNFF
jgi:hypothetical protein